MAIFLDRVDSAPLADDDFSYTFNSWISVTVDMINENLGDLETAINANDNGVIIPQFTQAQIIALAPTSPDGILWYCTDHIPPVYVGKINGLLVQFVTAAFP